MDKIKGLECLLLIFRLLLRRLSNMMKYYSLEYIWKKFQVNTHKVIVTSLTMNDCNGDETDYPDSKSS